MPVIAIMRATISLFVFKSILPFVVIPKSVTYITSLTKIAEFAFTVIKFSYTKGTSKVT